MANGRMIARLAELQEFAALKEYFDEHREEAVQKLARRNFAAPDTHVALEWHEIRAFYDGVDAVLKAPERIRKTQQKETQ